LACAAIPLNAPAAIRGEAQVLISRLVPQGLHEAGSCRSPLSENPCIPIGARVKPTLNFHHLMRDHSLAVDLGRMTETDAATTVARAIQQTLACARVNFWNVSGPVGKRQMRRITGYDGRAGRVLSEPLELQETTGEFFKRLHDTGCYVCPDTANDPLLREIFRTYLQPTQGLTMIVAAFYVDERVWGMISCVHDQARRWTSAEITALRKCASELSRRRERMLHC